MGSLPKDKQQEYKINSGDYIILESDHLFYRIKQNAETTISFAKQPMMRRTDDDLGTKLKRANEKVIEHCC